MSKDKEIQVPIVGVGTTFDVSGHQAKCVAIKREGVEIAMPDVPHPVLVDFDKIEQAVFGKK